MAVGIDRLVATQADAHAVMTAGYQLAKRVINGGASVRICVQQHEEDRTLQQNRYYWGVVLKDVSDQASIDGQRWAVEAWHELFRRQFIGMAIKKVTVAGRKKKVVIRSLRSTKDLKVRAFSLYLDQIIAFAVVDLSVRLSCDSWEAWQG